MLSKTNVTTSSQQRRCPPLVCTGSAAELKRRKIPSCCEGHSLRAWHKFPRQTDLRPVSSLLHLWLLWISLSVLNLNLIVRTEPRSVPRGNFCASSDRKWEDEQCYSTWRWVHAVPPRAEKRGRENNPVRWGSTAKQNVSPVLQNMSRPTQNLL